MNTKKYTALINFVLFEVCWFACVWGAANAFNWLGPAFAAILVPLQIVFLTKERIKEALFVILSGCIGFFLETILIEKSVYASLGQIQYRQSTPIWLVALWLNFGLLVSLSLSWLRNRYIVAAILGGVGGPIAYWGGERLGALEMQADFTKGYFILIISWSIVLPLLLFFHKMLFVTKKEYTEMS